MKQILKTMAALSLVLCLLISAWTVSAAKYDFTDGVVPDGWAMQDDKDALTATDILQPVNPNATQEARNLYAYLCALTDSQQLLVGQFDIKGNDEFYKFVATDLGFKPALYSTRYKQGTDPKPEWDPQNPNQLVNKPITFSNVDAVNALFLQHYQEGAVLLIHADRAYRDTTLDLLIGNGTYSDNLGMIKEFDKTNPDRNMQAYALWLEYQAQRNAALKALEDSGVKAYLFRELIEFNMHGFFGDSDSVVRVFQQTVENMIDYGLTGFLMTYAPSAHSDTIYANPGNDYVDVYSVTLYSKPEDSGRFKGTAFPQYDWFMKTGKPIGCSEFSCRRGESEKAASQPRASWFLSLQDIHSFWPGISWVNCWGDSAYSLVNSGESNGGNDDGLLFIDSPFTLHLGEIVDYQHTSFIAPGVAQLFKDGGGSGSYQGMEERSYTAQELKTQGIDLTAVRSVRLNTGYEITFFSGADCTGDSVRYALSQKNIPAETATKFRSCMVGPVTCVSLEKDIYASDNDQDSWKANDGLSSVWEGMLGADGTAWLYIDMETPYTISRYTVKNAGYAGRPEMYNTKDFQLQYSQDGKTWITLDTVTGNVLSQVTRNIPATTARYFRLLITGANSYVGANSRDLSTVTIAEFELYGIPAGGSGDTPREPDAEPVIDNKEPDDGDTTITDDSSAEPDGDPSDPDDKTGDGKKTTTRRRVVRQTQVGYFPWWGWLLIAGGVLAVGAVVVILIVVLRKKRQNKPQA